MKVVFLSALMCLSLTAAAAAETPRKKLVGPLDRVYEMLVDERAAQERRRLEDAARRREERRREKREGRAR